MSQLAHADANGQFLGTLTHGGRDYHAFIRFADQVLAAWPADNPIDSVERPFNDCLRHPRGSLLREAADLIPKVDLVEAVPADEGCRIQIARAYPCGGGVKPFDGMNIRELEAENLRLKQLVADLVLDRDMLRELVIRTAHIPSTLVAGSSGSCLWHSEWLGPWGVGSTD